jgi:hypothetical protein
MSTAVLELAERAPQRDPETVQEVIEWSKLNPLSWFIENLILQQGVHVLHGLEESFKTMLMLQMHEVLTKGGTFLRWEVRGGLRTGIAELEMKQQLSGRRFGNVWPGKEIPEIYVLPEKSRHQVLTAKGSDRIKVIVDWADEKHLDFVSIDSLAKLFPPGMDVSRQDLASDIFSQIQLLPTTMILAHDRKPPHEAKGAAVSGNAEIVGSGRMSQEPDVVLQVIRPDKRAPMVRLDCGKMREGTKPEPLDLYFDRVDFRLQAIHPFLHLLPATGPELTEEAKKRYGWKERNCAEYIKTLKDVPGIEVGTFKGSKRFASTLSLPDLYAAIQNAPEPDDAHVGAVPDTSPGN